MWWFHAGASEENVCKLKAAGNNLTDEQQIQAVIRSLLDLWEQMKLNVTHNESIQTLEDLSRHLELEAERCVAQGQSSAFFVKHGQRQAFKAKRKSYEKAPQQGQNGGKPPKRANTTKSPRGKTETSWTNVFWLWSSWSLHSWLHLTEEGTFWPIFSHYVLCSIITSTDCLLYPWLDYRHRSNRPCSER